MAKSNIKYKDLVISAAVTAVTVATVNALFLNRKKGLGAPGKVLANMPLKYQAKFADIVTAVNVNDKDWLGDQFSRTDPNDPNLYRNFNKTSIGNLAFVALHSKHGWARDKSREILANYKKYVS